MQKYPELFLWALIQNLLSVKEYYPNYNRLIKTFIENPKTNIYHINIVF